MIIAEPGSCTAMTLSHSRVLCIIAAACELIAALCVAGLNLGAPLAWCFGGIAAFFLAQA